MTVPRSGRAPLVVISAALLFIGSIFLIIAGSLFVTEQRYQRDGVQAEAVVFAKALRPATSSSSTAYEISYRFNLPDGTASEQVEDVPVHIWERVDRGSPLLIEHVVGRPGSARVVQDRSDQTVVAIALGVGGALALAGLIVLARNLLRRPSDDRIPASGDASAEPSTGSGGMAVPGYGQSFWPLARRSFGFWFGGIFLLVGLPFFIISSALFYNDWRFAREARSTQGMVLTKDIRESGNTRSRTKHYEATYRFRANEETLEGRDELSYEEWARLVEREPVEVRYRPQRPSFNRLAGHSGWLLETVFGLVGLVLTLVGGTIFVRAVRHSRLDWRLRQHGVGTPGTVTELQARNLRINNVQQWRLVFEYRDFQGNRHAKTINIPEGEAQRLKVGDVGKVLYDSAQPTQAVWLGRDDETQT